MVFFFIIGFGKTTADYLGTDGETDLPAPPTLALPPPTRSGR